jgi:hypothetical protein
LVISSLALTSPSLFQPTASAQHGQANGNVRKVKPEPPVKGAPPFDLPNLDEVKQRPQRGPEAAPAVSSSTRSRHKPLEPRRGRKVGDPSMSGGQGSGIGSQGLADNNSRRLLASRNNRPSARGETEIANDRTDRFSETLLARENSNETTHHHHSRRSISPAPVTVTETQFIQDFFAWALPTHSLTQNEQNYWNDVLRAAYPQGQTAMQKRR